MLEPNFTINALKQLGTMIMAAAVVFSLAQVSDHTADKAVLPAGAINFNALNDNQNPIRREREDSEPHYISYSESQRTPGRMGKR